MKYESSSTYESSHAVNTGSLTSIGLGRDFAYALSITGPSARSQYKSSYNTKGEYIDRDIVAKNSVTMDLADSLASSFMEHGYRLIEKNQLATAASDKKPKLSGSDDDYLTLGKLAGSDGILFVEVTQLAEKRIMEEDLTTGRRVPKTQYEMKYQIKLLSTDDGSIVLSGKNPPAGTSDFHDSLEDYAGSMSRALAWHMDRALKQLKEDPQ